MKEYIAKKQTNKKSNSITRRIFKPSSDFALVWRQVKFPQFVGHSLREVIHRTKSTPWSTVIELNADSSRTFTAPPAFLAAEINATRQSL